MLNSSSNKSSPRFKARTWRWKAFKLASFGRVESRTIYIEHRMFVATSKVNSSTIGKYHIASNMLMHERNWTYFHRFPGYCLVGDIAWILFVITQLGDLRGFRTTSYNGFLISDTVPWKLYFNCCENML